MKESIKAGVSFGLTSGIITTLALMIGLNEGTHLKIAVIGAVLTIAIADAFSDALGIHMSEESSKRNHKNAVWQATIATFLTKLVVALSFVVALLLFDLKTAIIINLVWGFILLISFNYALAKIRKEKPAEIIFEHVVIAVVVIIISFWIGKLISHFFG